MWTELDKGVHSITYGCDTGNGVIVRVGLGQAESLCFVPDVEILTFKDGNPFISVKKINHPISDPETSGSKQKSLFDEEEIPMKQANHDIVEFVKENRSAKNPLGIISKANHDPYKDI